MALKLSCEGKRVGSVSSLSESSSDGKRTRSHEMLTDRDVMTFLADVDAQVRRERRWMDDNQRKRLDALQLQAYTDDCDDLIDVVEFLEEENLKLVSSLSGGSPSCASV